MALHCGHEVREEVRPLMAVTPADRLREEDPFIEDWTKMAPNRIVCTRSRFEVDLNRPRHGAVYRTREDAWGIEVWKRPVPDSIVRPSLEAYDEFYRRLEELYSELTARHGKFVVFDLHSYNHRRSGPGRPADDPELNPQIDVGTGTRQHRDRWSGVIDQFMSDLAAFDFPGGRLDVRENVRFPLGVCGSWAHSAFPDSACVISVEVKKFFMDEWTGEVDSALHSAIGDALRATVPGVLNKLAELGD
jgi:hypothetical protein